MLFLFDTIWRHDQSGLACVRRLLSLYGSDRSVRNSTWVDLKIWIKFRPVRDLNPWPLRYQCSALPIELAKKLGAGYYVGSTTDTLCWRTLAYLQSLFLRFAFLPPCQAMYSHIPVDALSEADTNTFKSENWIFHLFTLACVRTLFTMYLFANGMFLRSTKVTCLEGSNIKELYCILLFIFFSFFFFEFQHWRQ